MKKQFLLTKCLVSATSISMQNYLKCNVNYWVFILILFCISGIDAKAQNLAQLDNLSDTWSKAPSAAYSTRKVLSSYTGAAMKLRRSNDDAQTDVFFDANGWVSMSSNVGTSNSGVTLQTWINQTVANQSAYVTKWYDQSGNGKDATPFECTGTVTCTTSVKSITGTSTYFSDELTAGQQIYDAATGNLVATVSSISGATITTVANPAIALTGGKIFTRESQPRFINAGNIETMANGRPTLYLNVTTTGYNSNGLTTPLVLSADANVDIFALAKRTSAPGTYTTLFGNFNGYNSADGSRMTAGYYSATGLVMRTNLFPTLATVLSTAYATRFWADGKKTTTTNENSGITQLDGSGTSTSATTSTGSITFTNTSKLQLFRPFQYPLRSLMGNCPELIYYANTTTDATFNATDATTLLSKQKACFLDAKAAPTVTTTAVTAVSGSSATSGGNVTADGNEILTAKGVCWSINHNPTIADSKTTDGTSSGVFTSTITGFTTGVTYYVRAYATNSQNTSYGSETSFTYTNAVSKPTVTTATVVATSLTTASAGGNVTADGNANVTARGVCWSTSTSPTIDLSPNTTDGSGTGSFTSSITGLTAGTTYYVRAYATNSEGTSYGNEITYTLTEPTVTTTSASSVTATSASAGGNVTADGNAAISARGVCWSTSTNPTIDLSTKTTDGSGSGSYTSSITSLSSGTTYYMKAYATNLVGTSYGAETSFTTQLSITANTSDAVKGSVSGGGSYASGATATLTATPLSGYRFINWTDNGTEVSNTRTYTFTVSTNKTLVANFGTAQSIYYVRPTGSTKWANIGATADQLITNSMFSLDVDAAGATKTYYFAAGTYTTPGNAQLQLTTGKLYGGFTGDEIAIDLNARATSDKDGNGLIEPWELTNEAILTTSTSTYKYSDTGTGNRFITVLGGELNGLTLTDYNYLTFGGAICLGQASGTPTDNASGSAGKLNRCTVRKIKSGFGVVMSTNTASTIDQCLIEDNFAATSFGGGVYLNRYGGTVSNTTIRNNKANTEGGAIYAGNGAAATDLKAIVSNCLIYNNTATTKGGAISSKSVDATHGGIEIVNSTIVNNTTGTNASVEFDGPGLIVNSIVTGDSKADLYATSTTNKVNAVVYGTTGSGSAILTETNTVSGQAYTALNFERPTLTAGYLGLTVDANYTAMRAAKFNVTNVNSPAVTTTAGTVANYNSVNTYSSSPTTDITGLERTGNITLGAYQATYSITSGASKIISQPISLASLTVSAGGKLTINDGVTLSIGSLTLESDATGTATMTDSYNTSTVNATVKQYVTAGRNWYLSSPITAADYTLLNRGTGGTSGVVEWNEVYKRWDDVTASNATLGKLVAGKGYIEVATTTITPPSVTGTTGTVNFNGTTNSGDVSVALSRTESGANRGFNLVGNPYPSYIDWKLVAAANPNVLPSIWFRTKKTDLAGGGYTFATVNIAAYLLKPTDAPVISNNTANTTITTFIPPMQAYWIRLNASPSTTDFKVTNLMRSHGDDAGNTFKAPAQKTSAQQLLHLQVSNGTVSDETVVYFNANASNGYDVFDSPKMPNGSASVPEIYTLADSEQLVINGLSSIPYDTELPIGFTTGTAGNFSLKASQLTNFDAGTQVILKDYADLNNPVSTDLTDGNSYSFKSAVTSNNCSRFTLTFRAPSVATGINPTENNNVWISTNANGQIIVNCNLTGESSVAVYNSIGQKVLNKKLKSASATLVNTLNPGVYMVTVCNAGKKITKKLIID